MKYLLFLIHLSTSFLVDKGLIYGFLTVYLESFFPFLPLSVFITLNINAFGFYLGVLISWIATCMGSISAYLFFHFLKKYFWKEKNFLMFKRIPFSEFVLLITLPFTPSFLLNGYCGMGGVSFYEYILAILIGKVFLILFWAYMGNGILSNLMDISSILFLGALLGIAYLLSKIIYKKINI